MYLNTTKKIKDTVYGNPADFIIGGVQNHRVIDTPHRGMWGGTPECKLNSGFLHQIPIPFHAQGMKE